MVDRQVLILVLLDDGLVLSDGRNISLRNLIVLILVLLDDGLVPFYLLFVYSQKFTS